VSQLVEFPSEDGPVVVVVEGGPVTRGGGGESGVVHRAQRTFEEAVARVRPAVQGMVRQMLDVAEPPDEVTIAFGLDLRADVGGVIAAAGSSANFTVELTWRKPPGEKRAAFG
jgi:hypothetical protein